MTSCTRVTDVYDSSSQILDSRCLVIFCARRDEHIFLHHRLRDVFVSGSTGHWVSAAVTTDSFAVSHRVFVNGSTVKLTFAATRELHAAVACQCDCSVCVCLRVSVGVQVLCVWVCVRVLCACVFLLCRVFSQMCSFCFGAATHSVGSP